MMEEGGGGEGRGGGKERKRRGGGGGDKKKRGRRESEQNDAVEGNGGKGSRRSEKPLIWSCLQFTMDSAKFGCWSCIPPWYCIVFPT